MALFAAMWSLPPPAALHHRPGQRKEGTDRTYRPGRGHQQPVWPTDRQCGYCLQLDAPVWIIDPVFGIGQRQGIRFAQADFTGSVEAYPFSWALCIPRQAAPD